MHHVNSSDSVLVDLNGVANEPNALQATEIYLKKKNADLAEALNVLLRHLETS